MKKYLLFYLHRLSHFSCGAVVNAERKNEMGRTVGFQSKSEVA